MKNATIIFSKNRALQCDLCLRSLLSNCDDVLLDSDISVLYKAEELHKESYEILKEEYTMVTFVEESEFKKGLLGLLTNKTSVLFICDDSIATERFSLEQVIEDINSNQDFIGFSLRLGRNTVKCFPMGDINQTIPDLKKIRKNHDAYSYQWKSAELDFAYPLEISSSVYRIKDIISILRDCEYNSPNTLEASMVSNLDYFVIDKPLLLCYAKSCFFSNPLNRVQVYNNNRCGNDNADDLLKIFMNGDRIDSANYLHFASTGAHQIADYSIVRGMLK